MVFQSVHPLPGQASVNIIFMTGGGELTYHGRRQVNGCRTRGDQLSILVINRGGENGNVASLNRHVRCNSWIREIRPTP